MQEISVKLWTRIVWSSDVSKYCSTKCTVDEAFNAVYIMSSYLVTQCSVLRHYHDCHIFTACPSSCRQLVQADCFTEWSGAAWNNTAMTLDAVKCRGYMCSYCMQRAAIPACTLSNVFENIQEAKVLQPMTAFGRITWSRCSTCVDLHVTYRVYCLPLIYVKS